MIKVETSLLQTEAPASLTEETFAQGLRVLCDRDPDCGGLDSQPLRQPSYVAPVFA